MRGKVRFYKCENWLKLAGQTELEKMRPHRAPACTAIYERQAKSRPEPNQTASKNRQVQWDPRNENKRENNQ